MKKSLCIFLVMMVSLTFTSCSDSEDKKTVDKSSTTEGTDTTEDEETKDNTIDDKADGNEKQIYINKLDNIQSGLADLDRLYRGSAPEMKTAVNEEYKRWDDALNEIYNVLRAQLSANVMGILEKEELQWIKDKEIKAKQVSLKFKGGTAESLIYTESLANTTKDRGYELVQKYMGDLV